MGNYTCGAIGTAGLPADQRQQLRQNRLPQHLRHACITGENTRSGKSPRGVTPPDGVTELRVETMDRLHCGETSDAVKLNLDTPHVGTPKLHDIIKFLTYYFKV
jgi:hypothetical protein